MGALTGHGPSLETDIACTNISLDLFGQVRSYYQYAAKLKGDNTTEYHFLFLTELEKSHDITLSAIAKKSIKEVSYHRRFSSDWMKRLGDGTAVSHEKIQEAINVLWTYTDELFHQTEADKVMVKENIGVDVTKLKEAYYSEIKAVLTEATLDIPESKWFQKGGKEGIHTEHLGYLLSDLQYMQRTYPNMEW